MKTGLPEKLILFAATLLVLAVMSGCASSPPPAPTPNLQEPVEVVSVFGPMPPINPGGPNVEITLKNVDSKPVVSLNATLQLNRANAFSFDVSASTPLLPGKNISTRRTLIGAGFSSDVSYPLVISGIMQGGADFNYTKQVQIKQP
jgi:hypothetical protein